MILKKTTTYKAFIKRLNVYIKLHMTKTEKNLQMRVYRLVYIFRFSVKKNNCDENSYKNMTM